MARKIQELEQEKVNLKRHITIMEKDRRHTEKQQETNIQEVNKQQNKIKVTRKDRQLQQRSDQQQQKDKITKIYKSPGSRIYERSSMQDDQGVAESSDWGPPPRERPPRRRAVLSQAGKRPTRLVPGNEETLLVKMRELLRAYKVGNPRIMDELNKTFETDEEYSTAPRETWASVVGRRKKTPTNRSGISDRAKPQSRPAQQQAQKTSQRRRAPRTAAVAIQCSNPDDYPTVLRKARERISLSELKIQITKTRRAINGGLIIEISGDDNEEKADILANRLKEILDTRVKITRPSKRAAIRIIGMDDSASAEEIAEIVSTIGGCSIADIKTGEIKQTNRGLGSILVQCPLSSAIKLANEGKIQVGWTAAGVILLEARPLQCFGCLEYGHIRSSCPNKVAEGIRCFNCGGGNHVMKQCTADPKCPLCEAKGLDARHRVGQGPCKPKDKHRNFNAQIAYKRPKPTTSNAMDTIQ